MPHINLLPWREQQRQASQQKFLILISSIVVLSLFIMYLIGGFYDSLRTGQEIKNNYLQAEIRKINTHIREINDLNTQKSNLQRRIRLIEELQGNRNLGTQVIDEIVRIVPSGVYLTSLELNGKMVKVIGRSESNNRLSQMLRQVDSSYLLEKPSIQGIITGEQTNRLLSDFTMHFYVKSYQDLEDAKDKSKE